MSVVVVGLGYVGLPLALAATAAGHDVTGLDLSPGVVDALSGGRSHVDDVSDADLQRALQQGFRATNDESVLSAADTIVVCVPTPLGADGGPDLSHVVAAATVIGEWVKPGTLCILESTTSPGSTNDVFVPLVAGDRWTVGEDLNVVFSPERVDPGNRSYGLHNTPKVVGGVTAACTARAVEFYETFVDTVIAVSTPREAELAKLIENTFRYVNIALVNEMMRFCEPLGIDIWEALEAASTKPFGYMPFWPGPGVGGHCIPVDPAYLSHQVRTQLGFPFRLVETAAEVNNAAPSYVATRVWQLLNRHEKPLQGSRVLLLGVTYKADIADVRESPATQVASVLQSWGAEISFHDPFVEEWSVPGAGAPLRSVEDPYAEAAACDVVVVLQAHRAYDVTRVAEAAPLLLDTRGVLPRAPHVERL